MTTRRWLFGIACMGLLVSLPQAGAQSKSKKKQLESYAVLGGTVFEESGLSLPGAKVELRLKSQPKKVLDQQTSSPHGEFAFRVPTDPATYTLTATLKGFESADLDVDVEGPVQIHKSLILSPASKKR